MTLCPLPPTVLSRTSISLLNSGSWLGGQMRGRFSRSQRSAIERELPHGLLIKLSRPSFMTPPARPNASLGILLFTLWRFRFAIIMVTLV